MNNTYSNTSFVRTLVRSNPLLLVLAAGLTIGCADLAPSEDVERQLTSEEADLLMASAESIEASEPTTRINKTSQGIEKVNTVTFDLVLPGGEIARMATSCSVSCTNGCSPSGCEVSSYGGHTICTSSKCVGVQCGGPTCTKTNN